MIEGRLWPGLCPWVLMHHLRVRRRGRGGSEEEGEREGVRRKGRGGSEEEGERVSEEGEGE